MVAKQFPRKLVSKIKILRKFFMVAKSFPRKLVSKIKILRKFLWLKIISSKIGFQDKNFENISYG